MDNKGGNKMMDALFLVLKESVPSIVHECLYEVNINKHVIKFSSLN